MVVVTLDQMILDELNNIDLNGMTVLSVAWDLEGLRIVFEIPPVKVEFIVNNEYQFQILSVNHSGVIYDDSQYLAQFNDLVIDVITQVKLIETKNRAKYEELKQQKLKQQEENFILNQGRLEAIMLREEKIKALEYQLYLKEQEIKDREKIVHDRETEVARKRQVEELKLEEKRLKNRRKYKSILRNGLIRKFKKQKDES